MKLLDRIFYRLGIYALAITVVCTALLVLFAIGWAFQHYTAITTTAFALAFIVLYCEIYLVKEEEDEDF